MSMIFERKNEYTTLHRVTIPFDMWQTVYLAHKKKWWKENSKWAVTRCKINNVWFTDTYGVTLNNGKQIHCSQFDMLFTNKEEAIEYCIKKNAHAKIKVYGE